MSNSYHLFLSNRVEALADELSRRLLSTAAHPFAEKIVIIQDEEIKFFLQRYFATHPQWNVAFGIHFYTLAQAISTLTGTRDQRIVNASELSLYIEHEIYRLPREEKILAPLFHYLEITPELSLKTQRRIGQLAEQLGSLFSRYGTYGGDWLKEWEQQEGWQQYLWKRLFSSGLTYPYRACALTPSTRSHLHLFALSFIPKIYLELFRQLPCTHYLLSPCEVFWEDIATEKERLFLHKLYPERNREELDHYLRDRNPLLASLGKYGREFLRLLDPIDPITEELYSDAEEHTTLTQLQNDMRLMRNPAQEPLPAIDDHSIQVHGAANRWREMEIVRDFLYQVIDQHRSDPDPITPADIVVLAPDITAYAPYIHAVFGSGESRFSYSIHDLPLSFESSLAQAFQHLLSLPSCRFEADAVCKLFLFDPFCQKFSLTAADVVKIRRWIEGARVRGGLEGEGSWEKGFERLLFGLAEFPSEEHPVPLPLVDISDAELLGTLISILRSLKENLRFLAGEKRMTYPEWLLFIRTLLQTYFAVDEEDYFWQELGSWMQRLRTLRESAVPFSSIERVLTMIWQKPQGTSFAPHLQRILFCSLRPAATLPAKVICLIGMEEGVFPRIERKRALDEMAGRKGTDYCPTATDQDRYLFLEQLLCARKYLWISFRTVDEKDHKPQLPSLAVQELLTYLNREAIHHPLLPFDASYFQTSSPFPSYSLSSYRAAKRMTQEPSSLAPFFPHFYSLTAGTASSAGEPSRSIEVRHLAQCARHPIKFYLEQALNLYLEEEKEADAEEFVLSHLEKGPLRRASLNAPLSALLAGAQAKGILPVGAFKEIAVEEISHDVEHYHAQLAAFSVQPKEVFSVELSPHCRTLKQLAPQRWIAPALQVELEGGRRAVISGKLNDLTAAGMLVHGENTVRDLVKVWPQFLIYSHLKELGISPCILFTKDGKKREMRDLSLQPYLHYYERCLSQASPLLPEWAEAFLLQGPEELNKAMQRSLCSSLSFQEDRFVQWLAARDPLPSAEFLFEQWAPYFRSLFPLEAP